MGKKNKFIKNLDKVFELRSKLGRIVTKECYQYFTHCEIKAVVDKGYIKKCKHNILDSKGKVIDRVDCLEFTPKLDRELSRRGYNVKYSSSSKSHDLSLCYNVTKFAKENNYTLSQYMSEAELETSSYSRPDGAFSTWDKGVIAIEQPTHNYRENMLQEKQNYCIEKGYSLYIF